MKKRIAYAVGILLALCMALIVVLGLGVGVGAEDTDNYSLTIRYTTGCERVELLIPGQAAQNVESNVPYAIPKTNATITIRVILKNGYEIDSMTGTQGTYVLDDQNSRTWTFTADDVVDLTCKAKEYEIKYLISESAGAHTQPSTGTFPKTYTFGDEGTKISMPVLDGFKFQYWILLSSRDATDESGIILSPKEGENFVTLSATTLPNTDTLYLRPKWEANNYEVYRYDYIFDPLSPDHRGARLSSDIVKWKAPMKSEVDGSMGEDRVYPGFVFINNSQYYTESVVTVSTDGVPLNVVYRLYVPLEYALDFVSGYEGEITFPEGIAKPETHVYNVETVIPDPVRTGYVFQGWMVTVVKNGVESSFSAPKGLTIDDMDQRYAGDKDTVIKLTAVWVSDEYTVYIDLNKGADGDQYEYSEKYVYDKGLSVTQPVRPGYTFLGWLINGEAEPKTGELLPFTFVGDITLVAQWKANEYNVTFDGMGATKPGSAGMKFTFDSALVLDGLILPEKEGHEFLGFATADGKLYIDADGKSLVAAWDIPEDTVLYASWKVLSYKVTVNATDCQIYIGDVLYQDAPIEIPYGTTVNIKIVATNAYKVTAWQGKAIAHTHVFETSMVMGANDAVLSATVLPMIAAPTFSVDYVTEQFITAEALPNGEYRIQCGSEQIQIKVENGKIRVNGVEVGTITIPESFFGKTVEMIALGDSQATADSDPVLVSIAGRPEMPRQNEHIGSIYPFGIDSIAVERNPNSNYQFEYEFAVSLNPNGIGLDGQWKSFADLRSPRENVYLFEGLNPGTVYYVYVRVKAQAGAYPHGEYNITQQNTLYTDYLNQKIDDLQKLVEETDGDIVKALVAKAIADVKALPTPSATFYEDLEGIYNRVLASIPFARRQDGKIAALYALRDSLIATNEFSGESVNKLNDLCSTAVSSIMASKTSDEVDSIYQSAVENMKAVKVSYLYCEDAKLTTSAGLPQGSKVHSQRKENIAALITAIDDAIAAGRIAVAGNSMTLAEAVEAFRSLDVMAGYTLKLSKNDAAYTNFDGTYEFRVLLPEELWGVSGLQVVYYDEKSGIEVLDTVRDGNYIVFTATSLADFAILGDPTMNLTPFIIALGLILACQLLAIILMLVRRVKNARRTYHASFALPTVALTIRFLPVNGLTMALVMGICVVVLQIVLMYLLLSTEMVSRRERSETRLHRAPAAVPTMAPTADEPEAADGYVSLDITEDAEDSDAFAAFEEQDLLEDDEVEDIDAEASQMTEDSVYVDLFTGEVFGDADAFIEPAANPKYSLPEDDYSEYEAEAADAELFDEDNADVEPADPEAVEWQFDESEAREEIEPLDEPFAEVADEEIVFEPDYDDELEDDYYDDSVRGEPAEDLPQEEPVTGEPANDYIEEEPVTGDLPEYEQSADAEETKRNGYDE